MLTKDDLNKIQLLITDGSNPIVRELGEVKREIGGIKKEIVGVKGEIDGVKDEISGVKREIGGIKKEIVGVKGEIDGVKDEIKDVKDSLRLIPTKEEYFDSMDKLMGEVKKGREEQEVIGEELSQHSDRLEKLEEKVGISTPAC